MKQAFITGTSSGIGQRFKTHLTDRGYGVRAPTRAELDLSNFDINTVDLKDYDYLILCAGVDTNGRQPFIKLKESDFINTLNVNLLANMRLIHKYVQQRRFKEWSKVIVIGSTIVNYVWPNFVAYGTSKVALETFVDSLSRELSDTGIGFSQIHPGLTKTNFHFNRGNGPVEDRDILYNTMPHITTDDLIPAFEEILNDQLHLVKKVTVSV
jgi:short-subunit dehydrogenase